LKLANLDAAVRLHSGHTIMVEALRAIHLHWRSSPGHRDRPDAWQRAIQANPAALEMGRLGGRKGGKAKSERLSPEISREIVQKAAHTRWSK